MTKSGRAEKSRTLFAHAILAQIKEEKLIPYVLLIIINIGNKFNLGIDSN